MSLTQAPNNSLTGYDKELMGYLYDHFQFIMSLSLKEQFDVLIDRFEWLLHEPTMFLVDRILYQDPTRNPYLMGNYAPVQHENEPYWIQQSHIVGRVPRDISGVYLRNGPNPKFIPSNGRQHWFDGDSMIHAIRIKNGKIQYMNKWAMTDKLQLEMKKNKPLTIRTGEFTQGPLSLYKAMLLKLYQAIGYYPQIEKFKEGPANTAFVTHANKTYALEEMSFPFEIEIPNDSHA